MRHAQRAIVLAALLFSLRPAIGQELPHHVAWRGSMVDTNGHTMELRVRTHLLLGRDIGPDYIGHIRCRGVGCPFRRGTLDGTPSDSLDVITLLTFGKRGMYCVHVDETQHLPDFAIEGAYTCEILGTKHRPDQLISEGTISLLRYRRPSN